jgi:hypothetical protein
MNNSKMSQVNYYSMDLANFYVNESLKNIGSFENTYLVIVILAVSVSFCLAIAVIPIIIRIESNKEKVFFIYAELSRNDIDDRKRNIRVFFAKLRQSTQNPGGSLFYEKSSRIVSSKLITRRFSNRDGTDGGGQNSHGMMMSGSMSGMGGGLVRQTGRASRSHLGSGMMLSKESGGIGGMRSRGLAGLLNEGTGDYEEDLQAEMMKQKEEQEAAAFKKFFHSRIKAMSCMKKVKHVSLVLFIAAIVMAYFLVKRSMILNI